MEIKGVDSLPDQHNIHETTAPQYLAYLYFFQNEIQQHNTTGNGMGMGKITRGGAREMKPLKHSRNTNKTPNNNETKYHNIKLLSNGITVL